jgi:hypothetical protein
MERGCVGLQLRLIYPTGDFPNDSAVYIFFLVTSLALFMGEIAQAAGNTSCSFAVCQYTTDISAAISIYKILANT